MGAPADQPVSTTRYALAWAVIVIPLAGVWCCGPWLDARAFAPAQVAALLVSWKVASLICLPAEAWARLTAPRLLAYCVWYGMQPRQFCRGATTAPGAPVPTLRGWLLNVLAGVALLWGAPLLLP